jgi:hypothetical protein
VDGNDAASVSVLQQELHHPAAELCGVGGCPDYRDNAWIEDCA